MLGAPLSGPEFQGSLRVNYNFDLFNNAEGNASVAVVHVSSYPNMFPNVPGQPGVISPTYDHTDEYTVVNATLAAAFDNYTVAAYVENLFDDSSISYVHPEGFVDSLYARVRPRTVGVRVGYEF